MGQGRWTPGRCVAESGSLLDWVGVDLWVRRSKNEDHQLLVKSKSFYFFGLRIFICKMTTMIPGPAYFRNLLHWSRQKWEWGGGVGRKLKLLSKHFEIWECSRNKHALRLSFHFERGSTVFYLLSAPQNYWDLQTLWTLGPESVWTRELTACLL